MNCLRGIVISTDDKLVSELDSVLFEVTSVLTMRKIRHLPTDSELESIVQLYAPSIVFLDMRDPDVALQFADLIQRHVQGVQLIGIVSEATRETLLAAVRAGMRDIISRPFTISDVDRAMTRIYKVFEQTPQPSKQRQRILSFLPTKVGSGTSTVALHTAFTMSRYGTARVALMDFDFDCGIVDFMLKLPFGHGMSDVAEFGPRMDESIWSRVVTKFGNLDVLRAGSPQHRVNCNQSEHLLSFARRAYDVICIDLPGPFDETAVSVFEQSHSVFLVCTPDLSSLHLARRRLDLLRERNLEDRAQVIYNRWTPGSLLTKEAVEDLLRTKVYAVIDNDYAALQGALVNGRPMDLNTPLGRNFSHLTNKILGIDDHSAGMEEPSSVWARLRNLFFPNKKEPLYGIEGKVPLQLAAPSSTGFDAISATPESKALMSLRRDPGFEAAN